MQKLQHMTYGMVAGSLLIHVFCCGLPLMMSLGSLLSSLGLAGFGLFNPEFLHEYERVIVLVSAAMLAITGVLQWVAKRQDCVEDGACHHAPCGKKKLTATQLYWLAVGIFALNLTVMVFSHSH